MTRLPSEGHDHKAPVHTRHQRHLNADSAARDSDTPAQVSLILFTDIFNSYVAGFEDVLVEPQFVIVGILVTFAAVHSGLAFLRPYGVCPLPSRAFAAVYLAAPCRRERDWRAGASSSPVLTKQSCAVQVRA